MQTQSSNITTQAPRINWRVNDFCQAHGIGRTSFYEEVKSGALKVFKLGSTTLVADAVAKSWQARKVSGGVA